MPTIQRSGSVDGAPTKVCGAVPLGPAVTRCTSCGRTRLLYVGVLRRLMAVWLSQPKTRFCRRASLCTNVGYGVPPQATVCPTSGVGTPPAVSAGVAFSHTLPVDFTPGMPMSTYEMVSLAL